ncbi:MAG: glycosyltransferase family 39 protein [Candidatus Heimdallarchaeota archaeon]
MKIVQEEQVTNLTLFITLLIATAFHIGLSLLTKSPTVFVTATDTARQIVDGKILYKDVEKPSTTGYAAWPPVFPYSLALWFMFMGQSEFAAKLFCVLTTIIAGYLCYIIGQEFLTAKQAYAAMLLFLFNPYTMLISLGGHFENYAAIFFLLAIRAIQKNRIGLAGIDLGIGIMTKLFPGLLLVVIVPFWIAHREYWTSILFLATTTIAVVFIALPFLIIAPDGFFYHVFEFHAKRDTGGISIYYYWFPWLFQEGFFILILQLIILGTLAFLVYGFSKKWTNATFSIILVLWTPIALLAFLCSARVLYPRYLAFLIPFISWQAVFLWSRALQREMGAIQLFGYLSMLGTLIWTLPWHLENHRPASFTPKIVLSNPDPLGLLYWIGAAIFDATLLLLLAGNIWLVKKFSSDLGEKENIIESKKLQLRI